MKITVFGIGYVGLSNAVLLAQNNEVVIVDINKDKVEMVNKKLSPLKDEYISKYLKNKNLNLMATIDYKEAIKDSDFIILAVPTDTNGNSGELNCSIIESIMDNIITDINACIIIRSTIPIGYTEILKEKYNYQNIIFVPEFLREGKALYDLLHPSRIIIGDTSNDAVIFSNLLSDSCNDYPTTIFMSSTEAESVKLFSNTYLAMRVAFFNELDSFAECNNLNSKNIINGVCLDPRIDKGYNNPSFGYGGYCLPKDTKQLLDSFKKANCPQELMTAICDSNDTRKNHIVSKVLDKQKQVIGIYKLSMKKGSDNSRSAAMIDIIKKLSENNVSMILYEPDIKDNDFFNNCLVVNNLEIFKESCDLIICNRYDDTLDDVKYKVYTRDIFREN